MDFSQWTRQDFIDFDSRRNEVMKPTSAELEAQAIEQEQSRLSYINQKLSALGITRPSVITKDFVIGMLTQMKAEQFIGKDFSTWVDNQILIYGSIDDAFDDLVSRFL